MAGSLAEIAHQTLRHDFRHIRPQDARIILMDGADRVLPTFPPDLSRKARMELERMHVEIRTGVNVVGVDDHGVALSGAAGNERLEARTVLWAGGVAIFGFGRTLAERLGAETDRRGRVKVTPELSVPGHKEIFVIGDLAAAEGPDAKPFPGLAPVAMQQGRYVGKLIAGRLRGGESPAPFHYLDKGDIAVIGRAAAVADIFGLHLWGWPAWVVWLFIHLMYLVEFQSRLVVFVHWAFQYLTFSRGARLITGSGEPDDALEGENSAANGTQRQNPKGRGA
jgi:NADH dehydrogenase